MPPRILVADTSANDRRLSAILAGQDVMFARTIGEAQRVLAQQQFDLVMIGVHFDDSRMFDLVRHVRAGGHHAGKPVACVRSHRFISAAAISLEGLEIAARALACNIFLDLTKYPDGAHGNAEVRKLLDALLTP
jgi:PleD family two-component response regulator